MKTKERELKGENYTLKKENKQLLEENLRLVRMAAYYQKRYFDAVQRV